MSNGIFKLPSLISFHENTHAGNTRELHKLHQSEPVYPR
ncbi:hypothetical protein ECP03047993_4170 [Escherichia coli P0304799.3]|nr:hypothetical protein ECP03047993_4170 [Escherichia coli P0304799.3]